MKRKLAANSTKKKVPPHKVKKGMAANATAITVCQTTNMSSTFHVTLYL